MELTGAFTAARTGVKLPLKSGFRYRSGKNHAGGVRSLYLGFPAGRMTGIRAGMFAFNPLFFLRTP